MKKICCVLLCLLWFARACCWGFFAHQKINYYAVFLLPPGMLVFYKAHAGFLSEHAVDPDKRRYAVAAEGPRHYIDLDRYGPPPWDSLPRTWAAAVQRFSEDSLHAHGIVPWWIQAMLQRLTKAFREKDAARILKLSAEIGHYIADAHVPLHASRNHNGQHTGQHGIHGCWESRLPELLAEKEWNFLIGKASYLQHPSDFIWHRVMESGRAADTVLAREKELTAYFPVDRKFAFEPRNGKLVRQYATGFSKAYDRLLDGMVERRMRQSVFAVSSFWYTAWVDAGQPDLAILTGFTFHPETQEEFDRLNRAWKTMEMIGRKEEE